MRERGERAAAARAVRSAAGALPRARMPAVWGWPAWPEAYPRPATRRRSQRFAADARRARRVLRSSCNGRPTCSSRRARARTRGARHARVGLYRDLACRSTAAAPRPGPTPDAVRAGRAASARRPTSSTCAGQDWGLPPLRPAAPARRAATRRSSTTLRANMRHAGALRIDHVMGADAPVLDPRGADAADGAYVHYPFDDLLGDPRAGKPAPSLPGDRRGPRHRARRGARRRCATRGVLSYRLLYFERDARRRIPAARATIRAQALVAASARTTCRRWPAGGQGATSRCAPSSACFPTTSCASSSARARAGPRAPAARAASAKACCRRARRRTRVAARD